MAKMRNIIAGLEILEKYVDADDYCQCAAEHDIFYAGPPDDPEAVSVDDKKLLEALGWFVDESCDSWAIFVRTNTMAYDTEDFDFDKYITPRDDEEDLPQDDLYDPEMWPTDEDDSIGEGEL